MQQNAGNAPSATAFACLGAFFVSTPAFQFSGDIFSSISGQFNTASLTNLARLQSIAHFNQITASIILTLQTFLQLKYQGIRDQNESPFSTHPIGMRVAVASSTVHYLAYVSVLRFPLHRLAFLAHHLLVSSGYIAIAALSSVFLPDTAAAFVYAIFGLLSAAESLLWLHRKLIEEEDEAEFWIQRWRIYRFWNNTFGDFWNFSGRRRWRLEV